MTWLRIEQWLGDNAGIVLAATMAALFAFVGVAIYHDMTAETFDLRRDSWRCSASHTESTMTMTKVGNVDVPVFNDSTICDQYTRKR